MRKRSEGELRRELERRVGRVRRLRDVGRELQGDEARGSTGRRLLSEMKAETRQIQVLRSLLPDRGRGARLMPVEGVSRPVDIAGLEWEAKLAERRAAW